MAYTKLSYNVDNLDKAKEIVSNNLHLFDKQFPERWALITDHHWAEKITLANKVIEHLNSK